MRLNNETVEYLDFRESALNLKILGLVHLSYGFGLGGVQSAPPNPKYRELRSKFSGLDFPDAGHPKNQALRSHYAGFCHP